MVSYNLSNLITFMVNGTLSGNISFLNPINFLPKLPHTQNWTFFFRSRRDAHGDIYHEVMVLRF